MSCHCNHKVLFSTTIQKYQNELKVIEFVFQLRPNPSIVEFIPGSKTNVQRTVRDNEYWLLLEILTKHRPIHLYVYMHKIVNCSNFGLLRCKSYDALFVRDKTWNVFLTETHIYFYWSLSWKFSSWVLIVFHNPGKLK